MLKTPIPEFLAEKIDAEFSLRPKLLSTAITFLAVGSSWYWNRAAKKERRRHRIPTDSRNVMNSDDQMLIECFVGINIIVEQLFDIPLESSYSTLGADGVFKIWWFYQLLMFLQ